MNFTILTLNLHSYQEFKSQGDTFAKRLQKHEPLFDRIATAITDLNVDVVCLQEVAEARTELLTTPYGQAPGNAAYRINMRIANGERYQLTQDWSHYAWDAWREGIAILSKHPIRNTSSRYITINRSKTWWKSRNILFAQIDLPKAGLLNLFSVHTGWWNDTEEPAKPQFDRLRAWADAEHTSSVAATFLCGDFNAPAGGPGYAYWQSAAEYSDQYLLANPNGMFDPTIEGHVDGWQGESLGRRIDYIYLKKGSLFKVQEAHSIFTPSDYGRVSDHAGIYAIFNYLDRPDR